MRSDLRMALAIGAEKALLKATGINQPLGLESNSDIRTITRSSANSITEDELLEAEESVLGSNVVMQSPSNRNQLQSGESNMNMRFKKAELTWIVSPKFRRLCKKTASLDGGSGNLWATGNTGSDAVTIHRDGSTRQPRLIEHEAYVSTFVTDGQAFFRQLERNNSKLFLKPTNFGRSVYIIDSLSCSGYSFAVFGLPYQTRRRGGKVERISRGEHKRMNKFQFRRLYIQTGLSTTFW